MMKKQIQTNEAPAAIGPYSQAIQVGDFTFYSGQIPLDPQSGVIVEGGIVSQTRQVMANMGAVLKASGRGFNDVVKTTIYLTDLADFATVEVLFDFDGRGHYVRVDRYLSPRQHGGRGDEVGGLSARA